jgi:hypothetical protein
VTVTIVGEFDGGGFVREVDDANPISGPGQYADLVESAVREGAAYHGLSDFVYRPTVVEKGNARRELSDGLVIAGGIALVLQIKSREPTAAATTRRNASDPGYRRMPRRRGVRWWAPCGRCGQLPPRSSSMRGGVAYR